tara:strand:+ start:204 stop:527 length:324 start_codon:yes stop_codon:yes gene_type:complete
MPKKMTLKEFLNSGNTAAIKRYKTKGILPSYVIRTKRSIGPAGASTVNKSGTKIKNTSGKPLSTFYGDPKKVTRGDVIAAAIAKKAKKKVKKKPKRTTPLKFVKSKG